METILWQDGGFVLMMMICEYDM